MVYSILLFAFFLYVRVQRKCVQLFGSVVFAYLIVAVLEAPCCFLAIVSNFVLICIYPFSVDRCQGRFFYLLRRGFCCFWYGFGSFPQRSVLCLGVLFHFRRFRRIRTYRIGVFSSFYQVIDDAVFDVFPMNRMPCFATKRVLHVLHITISLFSFCFVIVCFVFYK